MDWHLILKDNWFTLLQTISIVSSLIFAGVSFLIDARSRKVSYLIEFTKHHREIWREVRENPSLARVFDANVNISDTAVTLEEERFVQSLILHLNATHQAIRAGLFKAPENLDTDVREFFLLPIPNHVWHKAMPYQDRRLVEFINILITNNQRQ